VSRDLFRHFMHERAAATYESVKRFDAVAKTVGLLVFNKPIIIFSSG